MARLNRLIMVSLYVLSITVFLAIRANAITVSIAGNNATAVDVDGSDDAEDHEEWSRHPSITKSATVFSVSLDTDKVKHTVDRRFVSFGESVKHVCSGKDNEFPFRSPELLTLASGLSPAVFRVGGRSADEVIFVAGTDQRSANAVRYSQSTGAAVINQVLTGAEWKDLNKFATKAGIDLLFNLNLMLFDGDKWDPTNAKELLEFNSKLGYKVMWQLGNEPNLFPKNYGTRLSGRKVGKAFKRLRELLSEERFGSNDFLVGPDITHLHINTGADTLSSDVTRSLNLTRYLENFLHEAGKDINATTIHFYPIRKDNTTAGDNFTDPDIVDRVNKEMDAFAHTVRKSMPPGARARWLGETSICTNGGVQESERYVAGFILMSNLGVAASMDVSVFVYWNFFTGTYYSLIHVEDFKPKPTYWILYLHKRLVGTRVLSVSPLVALHPGSSPPAGSHSNNGSRESRYVRVYAHCTADSSPYPTGAVTLMATNMLKDSHASLHLTGRLADKSVDEYHLSPHDGSLYSQEINLNGVKLQMINGTTFPDIAPRPLPPGSNVILPPMTYGYYVIPDAEAPACMEDRHQPEVTPDSA